MTEQNTGAKKMPGGTLLGFMIMEIGIVLVLVAQSLHATSRLVVLWSGSLLLVAGILLFILFHTINKRKKTGKNNKDT